jgi:hypothetical protein
MYGVWSNAVKLARSAEASVSQTPSGRRRIGMVAAVPRPSFQM